MKIALYVAILIAVAAAAPATLEGPTPGRLDGLMRSIERTASHFTPKTDAEREALNKILEGVYDIGKAVYDINKTYIDIEDAALSAPSLFREYSIRFNFNAQRLDVWARKLSNLI